MKRLWKSGLFLFISVIISMGFFACREGASPDSSEKETRIPYPQTEVSQKGKLPVYQLYVGENQELQLSEETSYWIDRSFQNIPDGLSQTQQSRLAGLGKAPDGNEFVCIVEWQSFYYGLFQENGEWMVWSSEESPKPFEGSLPWEKFYRSAQKYWKQHVLESSGELYGGDSDRLFYLDGDSLSD